MTTTKTIGFLLAMISSTTQANADEMFGSLEQDCYQEWKARGWVIGEDNTPAHLVPRFDAGIKKICMVRSQLFASDPEISPYIQGRLPELAPYIFGADETAIESLIIKLKQRRPGPDYSGTFMRD